ncbi:ABC transporter permease [Yinghuangia seranimata]|uniref:ABC transporter permease n=1 Tax=Yinghuangia seranimata TaxID=408067 RepID=UPI00248CBB66|nr:FtsX-like permease family protein [Yinghuangia seranimata]MDI2132343.1 FtsX-like permease family protein [Yinghuangia seranimata]
MNIPATQGTSAHNTVARISLPRLALRNLLAYKRRIAGLLIAVILGTAFLSGALILSDTVQDSVSGLIRDNGAGTDVVVRNATDVTDQPGTNRAAIPAGTTDLVRGVPGVANAEPVIIGYGQLVDKDGKMIAGNGPRIASNWIGDPALNPYRLAEGRAPQGPEEVVVDRASARTAHLKPGDHITVLTPAPVAATIVGVATFGDVDAFGGSSYAGFSLEGARAHVARTPGEITSVSVRLAGDPDKAGQRAAAATIQKVLPPGTQALPGSDATQEQVDAVADGFLKVFRTFLTAFAGIALVVAAFSINHTFSVVSAQRTREAALLRALGASRRQIRTQALAEALIIGVTASVLGLLAGAGLAAGLKALFSAVGMELPGTGLTLRGVTAAIVLPVGIVVTLVSALIPALKASKVPPVAALRSSAAETSGIPARRTIAGVALTVAGAVLVALADNALVLAAGALAALAGVLLVAPVVVRAVGRVLTAPFAKLGAGPMLARGNVLRSPRRTAGAATAMVVGIAVVTVFAVFAASLKHGTEHETNSTLTDGVVIASSTGGYAGTGHSPELTRKTAALPGVAEAVGLQRGNILANGSSVAVMAGDTAHLDRALDLDLTHGTANALGTDKIAVSRKAADEDGLKVGSTVHALYPDGAKADLTVAGVYERNSVVGDYLIDRTAWAPHSVADLDALAVLALAPGAKADTVKAEVEALATAYGNPKVYDRAGYVDASLALVDMFVMVVYVLLALALLIALGGIANTLSLAAHERRREIGLLRAIGAERGQVRASLRWESAYVAALGALTGVLLGGFLAWSAVGVLSGAEDIPVSVPAGQLAILVAAGVLGGLLAGTRPAARAAKMDVLSAVAAD